MSKKASGGGLLVAAVVGYLGWRWWKNQPAPPMLAESTAKPQLIMMPGSPITLTTVVPTQETAQTAAQSIRQTIDTKNFIDPALLAFSMVPAAERASSADVLALLKAEGR